MGIGRKISLQRKQLGNGNEQRESKVRFYRDSASQSSKAISEESKSEITSDEKIRNFFRSSIDDETNGDDNQFRHKIEVINEENTNQKQKLESQQQQLNDQKLQLAEQKKQINDKNKRLEEQRKQFLEQKAVLDELRLLLDS